jgi:hypothetical protein
LWKTLFIPDGARLRISNHSVTRYAAIVGDDLVHNAMTMSPNQFVQMTLGAARNAWNVVYIQMPGEREWRLAIRLRHEQTAQARLRGDRPAGGTPPSTTQQAAPPAQAVAPLLPAAVQLIPQLRPDVEERRRTYRRAEDLLLE